MNDCKNCREQSKELHKTLLLLLAERQKNELYKQLVEQRYNMSFSNDSAVIEDIVSSINDRIFDNRQVAFEQPQSQQQSQQQSQSQVQQSQPLSQPPRKTKKIFKSAPKAAVMDEEENHENIKEVEERVHLENTRLFGEYDIDINVDMIENNMRQLMETKSTKDCTSILSEIKSQRQLLQLTLSPTEYGAFLVEHLDRIKKILSENETISKKLDIKKTTNLITRILTTLEQRLVFHQGFQNQTLSADEIAKYGRCLVLSAKHAKTTRTFVFDSFYEYFTNFSLALFSVVDIFEMYVANPYGFKNLCFVYFGTDNDYSFYHLEKYDGVTRYWGMDCRLESIGMKLIEVVRSYCTTLFRKIYKTCFNTNDYIEGYRSKFTVLEFDCEQLLRNILSTIHFNNFIKGLCNVLKKQCTLVPTSNDKFSSCTDNEEQAISFRRYELSKADIVATIETIFDNINESQCLELYKTSV